MEWLQGKKTYIVAILAGVMSILQMLGLLTFEQQEAIYGLLGAFGLAFLRAGVGEPKQSGKSQYKSGGF